MGIFSEKKVYITAALTSITVCVLMIIFSDTAVLSANKGIALWAASVLPAMLPFFICVNFMTEIGLTELLPRRVFPFVISFLSGYPMGAKVVGDLCRYGMIDKREAMRLISYCSTSGPVFMVGAVGVGMFGSKEAGFIIAAAHYLGAIVNGVLFSAILNGEQNVLYHHPEIKDVNLIEKLTIAIFTSFKSLAIILAYIIFFTFLMDLLNKTGFYDMIDSEIVKSLSQGAVEMTVGCSALSNAGLSIEQACVWSAVVISWGGLSIIGQSMSMLSESGITLRYIILTKTLHSLFAGIIALFLGKLMV